MANVSMYRVNLGELNEADLAISSWSHLFTCIHASALQPWLDFCSVCSSETIAIASFSVIPVWSFFAQLPHIGDQY